MNWKSAVVLIALASALGGFFYYDTYWLSPARDKEPDGDEVQELSRSVRYGVIPCSRLYAF